MATSSNRLPNRFGDHFQGPFTSTASPCLCGTQALALTLPHTRFRALRPRRTRAPPLCRPPSSSGNAFFKWWTSYPEKMKDQALAHCKAPSMDILGHELQLGHAAQYLQLEDESRVMKVRSRGAPVRATRHLL